MLLEIEIPKAKGKEVIGVLKALGVKINTHAKVPNQQTVVAIEDAREGKTKKIEDVNAFMDSF